MNLMRVKNLLRKKKVQASSQESTGHKDEARLITPHHLGGGLTTAANQRVVSAAPVSLLKRYTVILAGALAALGAGYYISVQLFLYGSIAFVIFASLFVVQILLLRRAGDILLASILDACGLLLFLAGADIRLALYLLAVLVAVFALAHFSSKHTADNMVRIRFFRMVRPGTGLLLVGLSLFASYVLFLNGQSLLKEENIVKLVNVAGRPVLGSRVADFSAEMPLDDFLYSFVRNELSQDEAFKNLPEFNKEKTIALQAANLASLLEARTGYTPQLDKSIAENIRAFTAAKTSTLYPESRIIRLALLTVVIVFVVKGLEFLIFPALALLAFIIYELMLGCGFAEIQFESRSKEVLYLPSRRS